MSKESSPERNQIMALVLCMAVLWIYPMALKKFYPAAAARPAAAPAADQAVENGEKPLSPPEGPFLEKPEAPAIIRFENNLYEAEFSTLGASVVRLVYKGDPENRDRTRAVLLNTTGEDPGLFAARFTNETTDLSRALFKLNKQDGDSFEFVYERQGQYRFVKRFFMSGTSAIINLEMEIENLSDTEKQFPVDLSLGLLAEANESTRIHDFEAVAWTDKVMASDHTRIRKKGFEVSGKIAWAGLLKKYFALLVKPDIQAMGYDVREVGHTLWADLKLEPVSVPAGQKITKQFFVYAGPQRYNTLKSFGVGFENILSRGFFGAFELLLLQAMKFSHKYTGNYGWDILLLTFLLKLLFSPLTHMSYNSMAKMKALQPRLQSIQERHKKDPTRMNKEMMELYKKNRVNPMGGCLPMVLQIPVFISFYNVLNKTIDLKGAAFIWWIKDLSEPDRLLMLPWDLPVIGHSFNLLPLLMLASMFVQQRLNPQGGMPSDQQKAFAFMPLIFGFIFYKMPSGLVLYWFLNNVLSIIQQGLVKPVVVALHHEDAKHT
ncbi:MAG TPA: membrane protein insertase YidC [Verrucomicrobiae bacterium]|nr:membrane protein insertase YidC [Verrucomicrobiae bacterium]